MSGVEEIVLSPALQVLFQALLEAVPDIVSKFGEAAGREVENWESQVPAAAIESALMLQHTSEAANRWVSEVKELCSDAEDISDGLKYESLRQQVEGRSSSLLPFISNSNPEALTKVNSRLQTLIEEKLKWYSSISNK